MAENALYYPYIHVRDVDWLKATLLLFSQVQRMVPVNLIVADTPAIEPFTRYISNRKPLLAPAEMSSVRTIEAQKKLANSLLRDADNPEFQRTFGLESARQGSQGSQDNTFGFQLHQGKLITELKDTLRRTNLAWDPGKFEPYSYGTEYIELHPRVGQAVMATLAIACAESEGLDIVGDSRSDALHKCLIEKNSDFIYDTWLNLDMQHQDTPDPRVATGRELFEFIIQLNCELNNLHPAHLSSMGDNREPLRKLITKLNDHAKNIDPMDDGPRRAERFKDEVTTIFSAWRRDRANMEAFWRQFFGSGLVDAGVKFVEKVADKTIAGAGAGVLGAAALPAAAGTVPSLTLATLATPAIIGATAGLGIGLVVHTGKSIAAIRKTERESPYRYLTLLEKGGVEFRGV